MILPTPSRLKKAASALPDTVIFPTPSTLALIVLQSVGNIIFTQSAGCACRLEGPSEFVEKTRVTVKNGTLVISYKDKNAKNIKNLTLYITAPDLSKVKIDGVGNFDAKEELKLKI